MTHKEDCLDYRLLIARIEGRLEGCRDILNWAVNWNGADVQELNGEIKLLESILEGEKE